VSATIHDNLGGIMPVPIVSPADVPVQPMPGRTLQWLATAETIGAQRLAMVRMECLPGAIVRPVHAHRDIEELIYILEGQGEAWVDGETAPFRAGDVVLFPANARHAVRNTGPVKLVAACFFAPATRADAYVLYEDIDPWPQA